MRRSVLLLAAGLLAPTAAGAFHALGAVWPDGEANVLIGNLSYWWASNIRETADEWSDRTSFHFSVLSNEHGPCSEDGLDLQNGVDFADKMCGREQFGDGVLAVTQWFEDDEGYFVAAGMTFNDAYAWAVYDGPWREDKADFRRVALHELGHWLGLDHEDSTPSIMGTYVSEIDELQQDDLDGAESLYGHYVAPPPPVEPLDPEVACRVDQRRVAGRLCKKHLRCEAKFAKDPAKDPGGASRDVCIAEARAGFVDAWDRAVDAALGAGETCSNEDAGASVEPTISAAALQVEIDIGPGDAANPLDRSLRSKLLKRTGTSRRGLRGLAADAVDPDAAALAAALLDAASDFAVDAQKLIDNAADDGVACDGAAPAALVPIVRHGNAIGARRSRRLRSRPRAPGRAKGEPAASFDALPSPQAAGHGSWVRGGRPLDRRAARADRVGRWTLRRNLAPHCRNSTAGSTSRTAASRPR